MESLGAFSRGARRCASRAHLGSAAVTFAEKAFGARTAGVVLLAPSLDRVIERKLIAMRDDEFEEYDGHWRHEDPIFGAAVSRLYPTAQSDLFVDDDWTRQSVLRNFGRRINVFQYLVVPLYGADDLIVGTVHICRPADRARFSSEDLRLAASFAALTSVHYERFSHGDGTPQIDLAPRELEVARLAARGYDNLVIARSLGIARETVKQTLRRVYRKLQVDSRAEMAVVLAQMNMV